jgi:hypothetical protein
MLSRRTALGFTLGFLAASRRRGAAAGVAADRLSPLSRDDALAALCSELGCSPAIGNACLRALTQDGTSPVDLWQRILDDISAEPGSPNAMMQRIGDRSRDDFRKGRIVLVDGWVLSLTETRVFALSAVLAERSIAGT